MYQSQFDTLHLGVDSAARHACQALVALGSLRNSGDPQQRAAYSVVHDLIGDLGSVSIQLDLFELATESGALSTGHRPVSS